MQPPSDMHSATPEAMPETVLVTGGAGYIGSIVTRELLSRNCKVVVVDNLQEGNRAAVDERATFVRGDFGSPALLNRVFREHHPDAVVHMAAETTIKLSMTAPEKYFLNNVSKGLRLLEAMRIHGVRQIVFSSTAAVYGEPQSTPIREDHPLQPVNAYGESKLMFERILTWYERAHGFRHVSFRYFNAAGSSEGVGEAHKHESHLIPLVLQKALDIRERGTAEPVAVFGTDFRTPDGSCVRDYVHVADIARAHVRALQRMDEVEHRVFNLGNGTGYSVLEVVNLAGEVAGLPIPWKAAPRRPGDPAVLLAAADRAKSELGWQPQVPELHRILESAWEWHAQHPRGFDDGEG